MSEAFNPYQEWLGLDGRIEAPNFYELVGVEPFEDDRVHLIAAVDKALVRVRGFRPGARAAAWAKLLDELAQAKACFQDAARKSAYDADLRRTQPSPGPAPAARGVAPQIAAVNLSPDLYPPGMAPKPSADTTPATAAAASVPVSHTRNPYPPGMGPVPKGTPAAPTPASKPRPVPPTVGQVPEPGTPAASAAAEPAGVSSVREPVPPGPVNAHVAPPRKPRASLVPIVAAIAGVVIIMTLVMLFVALRDKQAASAPAALNPGIPQATTPAPQPSAAPESLPAQPVIPGSPAGPPSGVSPAGNVSVGPRMPAAPIQMPTSPTTTPVLPNSPLETPNPQPPVAGSSSTPPATGVSQDPPDSSTTAPPANTVPDTDTAADVPAVSAALSRVLEQTQSAIADRQFRAAHRLLEQAEGLASHPEHRALVGRLRHLNDSAEQFWKVVATAMRKLDAAQELTIGAAAERLVIVVEAGPDSLTIHNQGRNETYTLADMPAGLGLAIARLAVDVNDAQSLVLFGACAATIKDRQPAHVDEARRYWEQAELRGADVDDLLATLPNADRP